MDDEVKCCESPAENHGVLSGGNGLLAAPDYARGTVASECDCAAEPASSNTHKIFIESVDYGYIVKVGCQRFAVETSEKLIKNLEAYLKNPTATERQWFKEKKLIDV